MSLLRNVLTYMGLGPDEDYEDGYGYDAVDGEIDLTDDEEPERRERRSGRRSARLAPPPPPAPTEADRALGPRSRTFDPQTDLEIDSGSPEAPREPDPPRIVDDRSTDQRAAADASVRPLRAVPPAPGPDDHHDDGITIRSVESRDEDVAVGVAGFDDPGQPRYVKPHALSPRSFGDAATLADEFKGGTPVIMNLQGVDRELARRLIDFASGICYALDGSMEKVAPQVFLLTPQTVEVTDDDRRLIGEDRYAP